MLRLGASQALAASRLTTLFLLFPILNPLHRNVSSTLCGRNKLIKYILTQLLKVSTAKLAAHKGIEPFSPD
jgi:hypothetical protein